MVLVAGIRRIRPVVDADENHLLGIGTCRSYAFVHNPSVMQWSFDRYAAFRQTLRDNGFWYRRSGTPPVAAAFVTHMFATASAA